VQVFEELDRLIALHDSGELTDDEFAAAKAKLLASGPRPNRWRERLPALKSRRVIIAAVAVLLVAVAAVTYALRPAHPTSPMAASQSQTPPDVVVPDTSVPEAAPTEDPAVPTTEATPDYTSNVTVLESGWGAIPDSGLATWGAVIRNTSDAWLQTNISAVALDSKGGPVDTATERVALPPNSTSSLAGTFLNPHGVRGVKVEAAPDFAQDHALYTGDLTLTGKLSGTESDTNIVWTLHSGLDSTLNQGAGLFAIFRDKAGRIVGGGTDFVPVTLGPGQTKTFTTAGGVQAPINAVRVQGWVDPTGFVAGS
jgi:Short C-terminal domain